MLAQQVRWEFTENERLGEISKKSRRLLKRVGWKDNQVKLFQFEVNERVEKTSQRVAPFHLQVAGFGVSLLICAAGVIVVTVGDGESESVVAGLFLFALGVICLGAGFWYRDQLQKRKWRSIAHELQCFFKEQSVKYRGIQFEFHIRGHHHRINKRTKKKERTALYHEKYILLTLPEQEFTPTLEGIGRRMSFKPAETGAVGSVDAYDVGYSNPKRSERKFTREDEGTDEKLVLPFWYLTAQDAEGRTYYINNFKKTTQWKPPTPAQVAEEKEAMKSILPPPRYDPKSQSKKKFEEVKKRSIIKRNSLIKIKRGESTTKEELIDVKPQDLPEEYRKQQKRERKSRPQSRNQSSSKRSAQRPQSRSQSRR